MSAGQAVWDLPGPARLLGTICAALQAEGAVAVRAPHRPEHAANAVADRLAQIGALRTLPVVLDGATPFGATLGRATGLPGTSAAYFATAPELHDTAVVVLVLPGAEHDAELAAFGRFAARAAREPPPGLVAIGGAELPALGAGRVREVRGAAGPLDAAAYAATLALPDDPFIGRLVTTIAIETAAWDLALLDRLVGLPLAQAVRPDLCVAAWADEPPGKWRGTRLEWEAGCHDHWGGEPTAHPLWLAENQPQRLATRVWRGQLMALMPWIETRRQAVVAAFGTRLRPDAWSGPDLALLDWGPLCHQLSGSPPWCRDLLGRFRQVRNQLAHGRPVEWPLIRQCLDSARIWDAGMADARHLGAAA